MTKKEIRTLMREKKKSLFEAEIISYSDTVCEILISQPIYKNAEAIYPYLAYNQEIITTRLIEQAWRDGKRVAVPKCFKNNEMEFFYIRSFGDVAPGYMDIPEPISGDIARDSSALMLMPGLAFDKSFNRIGYGGGFYDRYLDRYSKSRFIKAAFAYDFQLFEHIDTEEHDYKADLIITSAGCLYSPDIEKYI